MSERTARDGTEWIEPSVWEKLEWWGHAVTAWREDRQYPPDFPINLQVEYRQINRIRLNLLRGRELAGIESSKALAQARREEREAACQVVDIFKLPIGSDPTQGWSGLERWNASLDKISQAIRQQEEE